MTQRPGIRPFLLGLGACLLALAGQRGLQAGGAFDAWLLLGAGALLFVAVFRARRFDPVRATVVRAAGEAWRLPVRDPWGVRVGLGLLTLALLLTVNALQLFHDFEPFTVEA